MALKRTVERRLVMQGFSCNRDSGVSQIVKWLRFTPALSTTFILLGTFLTSPALLGVFAIISAMGGFSDRHLFDRIYNRWLSKYTRSGSLPPNPKPRRFAMLVAALWSAFAALLFIMGLPTAGYIVGFSLAAAGILVATTHYCLGSRIYRLWEQYGMRRSTDY